MAKRDDTNGNKKGNTHTHSNRISTNTRSQPMEKPVEHSKLISHLSKIDSLDHFSSNQHPMYQYENQQDQATHIGIPALNSFPLLHHPDHSEEDIKGSHRYQSI